MKNYKNLENEIGSRYGAWLKFREFPYGNDIFLNVRMSLFRDKISKDDKDNIALFFSDFDRLNSTDKLYAETLIQGYFLEDEIFQVRDFLKVYCPEAILIVEKERLPAVAHGYVGTSCIPTGGGQYNFPFYEAKGYDLSFPLVGFYNLRSCKLKKERH